MTAHDVTRARVRVLHWLLRLATAGAFIGHGAYGVIMEKRGWYGFFDALGVSMTTVDTHNLMRWVGGVEMALRALALLAPVWARLAAGIQTLSVRQSSSQAAATLNPSLMAFAACIAGGPKAVASRTPLHGAGGCGGAKRKGPTGG